MNVDDSDSNNGNGANMNGGDDVNCDDELSIGDCGDDKDGGGGDNIEAGWPALLESPRI